MSGLSNLASLMLAAAAVVGLTAPTARAGRVQPLLSTPPVWGSPSTVLANLDGSYQEFYGPFAPVFDSQGNAYLFELTWTADFVMQFNWTQAAAPFASWSPPMVAFTDASVVSQYDMGTADLVADHSGSLFFVVSYPLASGGNQLTARHYSSAGGWSDAVTVATAVPGRGYFYDAVDAAGDLIVVFPDVDASTYFHSAADDSWKVAPPVITKLAKSQYRASFQLASNASGSDIYAVYGISNGYGYGPIYSEKFDTSKRVWQLRRAVPSSRGKSGVVSAAVDAGGEVSVLYYGDSASRTIEASHTRNGFWALPTTVVDVTGSPTSPYLGHAVANAAGHVLAPVIAINSATTTQASVVRWNGSAWTTEAVQTSLSTGNSTFFAASLAWSGSGDVAVLLYNLGGPTPQSAYNDGVNGWSTPSALPNVAAYADLEVSRTPAGIPFALYDGPSTPEQPQFYTHQVNALQN